MRHIVTDLFEVLFGILGALIVTWAVIALIGFGWLAAIASWLGSGSRAERKAQRKADKERDKK